MVRTVFFDLDGTLLDTIADLTTAANCLCRENGWPSHSQAEIQSMVGHGMENFIAALTPPEDHAPERLALFLDRFRIHYGSCLLDQTRPYPGIPDLLDRLADVYGIRMAVYSNKDDVFSQTLIHTHFPGRFALVQGKRPEVPPKPDPSGVLRAMRLLDAAPEAALFVGDSATDVRTGHNAGLAACAVTWGYRPLSSLLAAGPEYVADSPGDLERVISGGGANGFP